MAMRWDQVSFERGEWRIPVTKSGKPHVVPVLPDALNILRRRKKTVDGERKKIVDGEYVFPGTGEAGHLIEPKKGWRRILARAELYQLVDWIAQAQGWTKDQISVAKGAADLRKAVREARSAAKALKIDPGPARIHDLRRTLGSWQAATGASLLMIGRTLAHKNVSTTAIYARLNLDPVRESMQKATTAMLSAGGLLPAGDVVSLQAAKSAKARG